MRFANFAVRGRPHLILTGLVLLSASLAAATAASAHADGSKIGLTWVRTTDKNGVVFGSPAHPSVHYTKGQQFNEIFTVSNPVGPGVAKGVYLTITINPDSLQSIVKNVQVLPPPGAGHWATCAQAGPVYTCQLRASLSVGGKQQIRVAFLPANGKFNPTVAAGSAS